MKPVPAPALSAFRISSPAMRRFPVWALLGLLSCQAAIAAQPARRNPRSDTLAAARHEARLLVTEGKVDDAGRLLAQLNRAPASTPEWHLELAQRFARVAADSAAANPAGVAPAVQRALAHVQEAERLASSAELKASARSLAGFLCERFLGDVEAAKANYRAAAQHAPGDKQAQARAERFERAEHNADRAGGREE